MDCLLRSTPHKDSVVFFFLSFYSSVWPSIAHLLSLSFVILLIFRSANVPKPCRCSEHDRMYGGDFTTLPLHWTYLPFGSPSLISDKSRMRTWWGTGNLRRAALYSVWPRRSSTKHFHRAILFTETGDSLLCSQELANLPILNQATLTHTYSLYLSITSFTAHSTWPVLFLCRISFSVLAPNIVFRLKMQIK
jgi:hypothetical protein